MPLCLLVLECCGTGAGLDLDFESEEREELEEEKMDKRADFDLYD